MKRSVAPRPPSLSSLKNRSYDRRILDDLLRSVPGVQPATLSSRYNHPTAQSVTLNGLGSRRALVLLDGVPFNDGFGGWINWGLVPNEIERVEIVPVGSSNLYGTWAMDGVIHVITKAPGTGPGLILDSQAGNLSTYQQAVTMPTPSPWPTSSSWTLPWT